MRYLAAAYHRLSETSLTVCTDQNFSRIIKCSCGHQDGCKDGCELSHRTVILESRSWAHLDSLRMEETSYKNLIAQANNLTLPSYASNYLMLTHINGYISFFFFKKCKRFWFCFVKQNGCFQNASFGSTPVPLFGVQL